MNKQTILHILAFMKRAPLNGEEVPAYNQCINELNEEYTREEVIEPELKKEGE